MPRVWLWLKGCLTCVWFWGAFSQLDELPYQIAMETRLCRNKKLHCSDQELNVIFWHNKTLSLVKLKLRFINKLGKQNWAKLPMVSFLLGPQRNRTWMQIWHAKRLTIIPWEEKIRTSAKTGRERSRKQLSAWQIVWEAAWSPSSFRACCCPESWHLTCAFDMPTSRLQGTSTLMKRRVRVSGIIWFPSSIPAWLAAALAQTDHAISTGSHSMLFHDSANPHQDALSGLLPPLPTFFPLLSPLLLAAHGSRQPKLHNVGSRHLVCPSKKRAPFDGNFSRKPKCTSHKFMQV